jgi:hypothetical protein
MDAALAELIGKAGLRRDAGAAGERAQQSHK